MRIWFDIVTKRDAKALMHWWNSHTIHSHDIRRSLSNPRYWAVWRTS